MLSLYIHLVGINVIIIIITSDQTMDRESTSTTMGRKLVLNPTKSSGSRSPGDGRIVVGRFATDQDRHYATVMVDELLFFNQRLTPAEIVNLATVV